MARGRDECEWNRTRALAEIIWAQWSKTPLPPALCQPYLRNRKRSKLENERNMDELCRALAGMAGGNR